MVDYEIVIDNIRRSLGYVANEPMLFNSGLFLLFFTVFLFFYAFFYNQITFRLIYVIAFSFFFYYKSSGIYLLNLLLLIVLDYFFAQWLYQTQNKQSRNALLTIAIFINLSFLLYFKYTNFIFENIAFALSHDYQKLDIFLPIGISFYTFQTISYLVDVSKREIKPSRNILDFAFYLSFFPQLVAGPIVRAKEFLPQIRQKITFTSAMMGEGLFMVVKGLFKKAVIADYMAQYADIVYSNPSGYSGFENLMAMYTYTLQIYCDFSGYSDMAIGMALIMGFQLPDNFRSPYQSLSITEFWRKWHITLSFWLRDYIYIPLGGNRKGKLNQYLFLLITMLVGGFWHGASWKFVFWGGAHGIGLAIHKKFSELVQNIKVPNVISTPLSWFLTFHFVAFLWIFFRANTFQDAFISIELIFTAMDWAYIQPFWEVRQLLVIMMLIGYAIHFMPDDWKTKSADIFTASPLLVKTAVLVIIIQLVIQFKSENVQPFIYFQF